MIYAVDAWLSSDLSFPYDCIAEEHFVNFETVAKSYTTNYTIPVKKNPTKSEKISEKTGYLL